MITGQWQQQQKEWNELLDTKQFSQAQAQALHQSVGDERRRARLGGVVLRRVLRAERDEAALEDDEPDALADAEAQRLGRKPAVQRPGALLARDARQRGEHARVAARRPRDLRLEARLDDIKRRVERRRGDADADADGELARGAGGARVERRQRLLDDVDAACEGWGLGDEEESG